MIPLDPLGNIILALQIVILFLLIIGLPLVRGERNLENLTLHGYLTLAAIILHTIIIAIIMAPSTSTNFEEIIGELNPLSAVIIWSHLILGTAAEVLGIILIGAWLSKPTSRINCTKLKKWMMPTFIIWVISIINGAAIHILGLL